MLAQNLGASRVKCETGPYTWRARRESREGLSTPDRCMAVLISKETYLGSLSWAATQGVVVSLHSPARILQVYVEAFTGFSPVYCPDKLTLLFQVCIFENSSHCGSGGWNIQVHSKDREWGEELPIAWVQLASQPMTSFNKKFQPIGCLYMLLTWGTETLITYCPHLIRTSLNTTLISGRKASSKCGELASPLDPPSSSGVSLTQNGHSIGFLAGQ